MFNYIHEHNDNSCIFYDFMKFSAVLYEDMYEQMVLKASTKHSCTVKCILQYCYIMLLKILKVVEIQKFLMYLYVYRKLHNFNVQRNFQFKKLY